LAFFPNYRFENQILTKIKKQAMCFRLLLIYCTHPTPIIELFLARFGEVKRFHSTLKYGLNSALKKALL